MIILGSASPRRKALFEQLNIPFRIIVIESDESVNLEIQPHEMACIIAERKMDALHDKVRGDNDCLVTADTIVVNNNIILGKPKDRDDAYRMIASLSGAMHSVITGVCVDYKEKRTTFYEETFVWFSELTDADIERYLDKNDYSDKAGSYGIQGEASFMIKKLNGDYNNVVGFPMNRFLQEVKNVFGKDVNAL